MKFLSCLLLLPIVLHVVESGVIPLHKRSAFYIANETACVVDGIVYYNGDRIPTDNPCESCRCRPPGFACVLHECEIKHGCKAIRREGECCPDYLCGCEHNGQLYRNGDEIRDPQNPCYKCHCQGNSIACAFAECVFRRDCMPRFVTGECCPRYDHCPLPGKIHLHFNDLAFCTSSLFCKYILKYMH
ncbi:kielin/chordin-like protein [Centruroides sculpturatus]|uniref:kielin/chordin-like protein n=1 Tax=Centruroides sculpturatus TaxID=218467 RepID=UPI000C6D7FB0|nr:kielin/chordin-like protein [Centruroides sculpturatus]